MRFFSLSIIALIGILVFTSAGIIVSRTITDSESNIKVAERVAMNVMDITSLSAKEKDMLAPTPSPEVAGAKVVACDPKAPFMQTQVSVVNYLKLNGFSAKFADRVKIAADHGFHGYTGSSADNLRLVQYLKEDLAAQNNCNI